MTYLLHDGKKLTREIAELPEGAKPIGELADQDGWNGGTLYQDGDRVFAVEATLSPMAETQSQGKK